MHCTHALVPENDWGDVMMIWKRCEVSFGGRLLGAALQLWARPDTPLVRDPMTMLSRAFSYAVYALGLQRVEHVLLATLQCHTSRLVFASSFHIGPPQGTKKARSKAMSHRTCFLPVTTGFFDTKGRYNDKMRGSVGRRVPAAWRPSQIKLPLVSGRRVASMEPQSNQPRSNSLTPQVSRAPCRRT